MEAHRANSVLICATPKTGNLWLRFCLERGLHLRPEDGGSDDQVRNLLAADGTVSAFPFIAHTHIQASPIYRQLAAENRTDIVTLMRHPVDVLISLRRHHIRHQTSIWPETMLLADETIATYVERIFPVLLGVTASWAKIGAHPVRYEDMCRNPAEAFTDIAQKLRPGSAARSLGQFMARISSLDYVRSAARPEDRDHFSVGRPDQWALPENQRMVEICQNSPLLRDVVESWGYNFDIDKSLHETHRVSSECPQDPLSAIDLFDNGEMFSPFLKIVFHYNQYVAAAQFDVATPASVSAGSFYAWLGEVSQDGALALSGMSNLEREVLRFRPDGALAFSRGLRLDIHRFRAWLFVHAAQELLLPPRLLESVGRRIAML